MRLASGWSSDLYSAGLSPGGVRFARHAIFAISAMSAGYLEGAGFSAAFCDVLRDTVAMRVRGRICSPERRCGRPGAGPGGQEWFPPTPLSGVGGRGGSGEPRGVGLAAGGPASRMPSLVTWGGWRARRVRRVLGGRLASGQPAGEGVEASAEGGGASVKDVQIFDRYEGEGLAKGRVSVAFRLVFQRTDRTLKDAEVAKATERVVQMLAHRFGGELR